jgi:hypothetical protein
MPLFHIWWELWSFGANNFVEIDESRHLRIALASGKRRNCGGATQLRPRRLAPAQPEEE